MSLSLSLFSAAYDATFISSVGQNTSRDFLFIQAKPQPDKSILKIS